MFGEGVVGGRRAARRQGKLRRQSERRQSCRVRQTQRILFAGLSSESASIWADDNLLPLAEMVAPPAATLNNNQAILCERECVMRASLLAKPAARPLTNS